MLKEKRAREIEGKAKKQRESLAGVSNTAPLNVQVRFQIYSLMWHLKQRYHNTANPLSYVSKKRYEEDLGKITAIEAKIITGGSDEERARKAVNEAKEYLSIVAESRIRDNRKCRVF